MINEMNCINCNWLKEQSGSCDYLCPYWNDISFSMINPLERAQKCELFVLQKENYNPKCNSFMVWSGLSSV